MTLALPTSPDAPPMIQFLDGLFGKRRDPAVVAGVVDQLVAAVRAGDRLDHLHGLPLVSIEAHAVVPLVTVTVDGWTFTLSADDARAAAVRIDDTGKGGAALDLMELCDQAEEISAVIAGRR